jgi:protein phosphatase
VEELRRRGQLTPEQAEDHPQRSVITRALGPEPEVEPDVHTHQARTGDVFLLCSDGLTSMVREERVREIAAGAGSLQEMVDALVDEANREGGRDNITVVAFRVGGDELAAVAQDETAMDLRAAAPATEEHEGATPAEGVPVAAAQPPRAEPSRPARRRSRMTGRRLVIGLLAVAIGLGIVFGGIAGLHRVYFVGTDRGLVTLYRGVPYELPFGIDLYEKEYVSAVPVNALSTTERRRLLDHQLRSKNDAADLVRGLERGRGF